MATSKQARQPLPGFFIALLIGAVALNAAGAMIVEIVAGRILAPYFGMSLYTWTTVIGVVLAGLTLGHWLGGRLAGVEPEELLRRIGYAFWAGAVATILVIPLTVLVAGGLSKGAVAAPLAILLSGFAAFFVPSLLAGVVQPIATTFALILEGGVSGPVIGRMLAAGALGSILGTFAAGFVLISYLGSSGTLWLVAALNAALGALFWPGLTRSGLALAAAILATGAGLAGMRPQLPGISLPCQEESRYFCISIDPADQFTGRPSRLMALDHLVHSVSDEADPQRLFSPYVHLVDEFVRASFGATPFEAFFIGGGGYTLPRAWAARNANARMTVAEIDPVVTAMAREHMWFEPGDMVRTLNQDARVALSHAPGQARYDVIFGDAFQDVSIPAHLVSDEFHALVASRLRPGGFYVINVVDSPKQPRLLASIVRTLKKRFAEVEVWASPDVSGAGRATFIVYASDRPTGFASTYRAQRGEQRVWLRVSHASLRLDRWGVVLTDDYAPVDRLLAGLWWKGQ